jgi:hypothetical protein
MRRIFLMFFFGLLIMGNPTFAQIKAVPPLIDFTAIEDSLHRMAMRIIEPREDSERLERNASFLESLREALLVDSALTHPFDSVRTVSFLPDPGGKFRIVTWYVPLVSGQFQYYGFVQTKATEKEAGRLFILNDLTLMLNQVSARELNHDEWFGAYYYELIHLRERRKDYFTLLGWKGDNPASRKRVIEPFRLTEQGPVFGAPVFDAGDHKPFRVIFEYSARVSMSLKYHAEFPVRRRRTIPMIIFDRLSPTHETLRGNFQFYVPEVNVFDGFRFKDGRWVFVPDVDARVTMDPSLVPLNPPQNP